MARAAGQELNLIRHLRMLPKNMSGNTEIDVGRRILWHFNAVQQLPAAAGALAACQAKSCCAVGYVKCGWPENLT
jgi:hypothetical protein